MTCEQARTLLGGFIDGNLSDGDRSRLEVHLSGCPSCGRELESVRNLLSDAAGLTPEILPTRDLWPEVESRIREERPAAARRLWRQPVFAAAALLLLAVGASLALPRMIEKGMGSIEWITTEWQVGQLMTAAIERQYLGAIEELSYAVAERRASIPEETLEVIDRDLQMLDSCIVESRSALMKNPSDKELQSTLSTVYSQKVELLRWTAHIATSNE